MEGISVEQAMEQILQYTPVINETEEVELNKAGGKNPGAGYGGRI